MSGWQGQSFAPSLRQGFAELGLFDTAPDLPPPGLYRIYWKSGGDSLAAVGMTHEGARWLAPINWVWPTTSLKSWSGIERIERINA
jgi:hypothetical protein